MTSVTIPHKTFGNATKKVSVMGLGCMGLSEFYTAKPVSDEEGIKLIRTAFERGINFFDTADAYGPYHNEILLGKAIKGLPREELFIATKFSFQRDDSGKWMGVSGKPDYVKKACADSLKRLDVDYIDLYYQHRVDPATPIEETMGALVELVKEGKIKHIGLSEASAETIRRAHKIHPITAVQTEYSLWTTFAEKDIIPTCKELGIAFVPYSPLGRGFLTGQIKSIDDLEKNDWRRKAPRFSPENFPKNLELVEQVKQIAKEKGCTPGQLALAWVLAKDPDNMFPIPGTKQLKYLEENIASVNVHLTKEDLDRLRPITEQLSKTEHLRYDENSIKLING